MTTGTPRLTHLGPQPVNINAHGFKGSGRETEGVVQQAEKQVFRRLLFLVCHRGRRYVDD